jgi:hypothetical protein
MDTCRHLSPDTEDVGRTAIDQALAPALAEQNEGRQLTRSIRTDPETSAEAFD